MRKIILLFICVVTALYFQLVTPGCANIIPPEGGPRDTAGPKLVEALPANGTVNFRGKRITLTFDEYVDLQDVSNNLLFTPTLTRNPTVEVKLRTITIRLPDSLEANTTYVFNFGNAIKDMNEGNVARDFVYRFSTGPAMDSLELKGKVILAENGRIDSTLVVVLHRNLSDSAIAKERPRYISRLNSRGEYHFKNLPAGTFAIYALGEAGSMRRYLSKTQTFAFSDFPVTVGDTTQPPVLYAYKERETNTTTASGNSTRVGNINDRRLRFTMNLSANHLDLLKDLEITFEQKLKYLDSTKVRLTSDSTYRPEAFSIRMDSTMKVATVESAWKEGTRYHLIVDKEFAEDSLGRKLFKSDTLSFNTRKKSEYGSLFVKLRNAAALKNPVLQLTQNGIVVYSASLKSGSMKEELFAPGEYEIRILEDINGNGKWDPGQFLPARRQPEIARPIDRKLNVRAAFQNEFEVAL